MFPNEPLMVPTVEYPVFWLWVRSSDDRIPLMEMYGYERQLQLSARLREVSRALRDFDKMDPPTLTIHQQQDHVIQQLAAHTDTVDEEDDNHPLPPTPLKEVVLDHVPIEQTTRKARAPAKPKAPITTPGPAPSTPALAAPTEELLLETEPPRLRCERITASGRVCGTLCKPGMTVCWRNHRSVNREDSSSSQQ
jgi:hypothetical protein